MSNSKNMIVSFGNFINEITYKVDLGLRILMGVLLSLIFLQLVAQVVLRYFIRIPLSWIEELTAFMLAYLVVIGLAVCFRAGKHVIMDTIHKMMPISIQSILEIVFYLIAIYFSYLMIFSGLRLASLGASDLTYSGYFTLFWPRLALPIGGALLILNASVMLALELIWWLTGNRIKVKCHSLP